MNKQRIQTNALKTIANITYYGGTLGAGIALYELMNQPSALGIVVLLVFTLTVEGILRTLIDEALDAVQPQPATTPAVSLAKEDAR